MVHPNDDKTYRGKHFSEQQLKQMFRDLCREQEQHGRREMRNARVGRRVCTTRSRVGRKKMIKPLRKIVYRTVSSAAIRVGLAMAAAIFFFSFTRKRFKSHYLTF